MDRNDSAVLPESRRFVTTKPALEVVYRPENTRDNSRKKCSRLDDIWYIDGQNVILGTNIVSGNV